MFSLALSSPPPLPCHPPPHRTAIAVQVPPGKGGAKNKNTSSENRRLGAMLAKRYEDGGMKSRLSKQGYSVLLQHLLSTVISNYDALAGAGVRRPLMPDLED